MSVVAIVGCGNMGEAIAAGLVASGRDPREIVASHPRTLRRAQLEGTHRIRTTASNGDAVREADVVLIAVKPQILGAVLPEIAAAATRKLVVSLCAGTPLATFEAALPESRLVRAMPNQPASVRGRTRIGRPALRCPRAGRPRHRHRDPDALSGAAL